MFSKFLIFCCFLIVGQLTNAENLRVRNCSDSPSDYPCEITEVRVLPCKDAAKKNQCIVKKGTSPTIQFDYIPDFNGNTMNMMAYWAKGVEDLAFEGMETNACNSTTCPVVAGTPNKFSYDLYLAKSLPLGLYDVKWKLWNEENKTCCTMLKVKLIK